MFSNLIKKFKRSVSDPRRSKRYKKTVISLQKRPFLSFFLALGLLLAVIIFGNILTRLGNKPAQEKTAVKTTEVYSIGKEPKITLQAQVNQEGVVEIVAQTSGIVQEVYVFEGDTVYEGQTLVQLATNYQGGNAPALQASLAKLQYKNVTDTYDTQKDLLAKQKELTENNSNNTEELRKISDSAKQDTSGLLDQNEQILNTLSQQLEDLKQSGTATEAEILQAEQLKAQAQTGVNQLRASLRSLTYATDTSNPPTNLSNLQKDISLKQLELQGKALELSQETSKIQFNLALVQAALMRPASPFAGTVERVYVSPGESVNPGKVLAVIASHTPEASITVMVPQDIASTVSRVEPSILHIQGKSLKLTPSYVSNVATNSLLYTILYNLPDAYISKVTNNSFISIEIPIGYADSTASVPFIPIDSVFQSQNASYVFLTDKNVAKVQKVVLGAVYGSFVEVTKGIKNGDQIILNRSVVNGEKIKIQD